MLKFIHDMWGILNVRQAQLGVFTRTLLIPFGTAPTINIVLHNISVSSDGVTTLIFESTPDGLSFTQVGIKQYIPGRGVGMAGPMWERLPPGTQLVWSQTGTGNLEVYVEYHLQ